MRKASVKAKLYFHPEGKHVVIDTNGRSKEVELKDIEFEIMVRDREDFGSQEFFETLEQLANSTFRNYLTVSFSEAKFTD